MREQRTDSVAPAHRDRQDSATAAERSLRARLAAYAMHAQHDARITTANGRTAFLSRFEREVDPDGVLTPDERARRADHARSAYFSRLSLSAAKARRARRAEGGASA